MQPPLSPHVLIQPILEGNSVRLRPMVASDFEELFEVASDPLLWAQHPEPNRYQKPVFTRFFEGGLASKGALVIVQKVSGKLIGSSRFYNELPLKGTLCIGYTFIGRQWWGTDINRQVKQLMVNHALTRVQKVYFEVGETNYRSRRALEKLGAQLLGPLDLPDGEPPHLVYELQKPLT